MISSLAHHPGAEINDSGTTGIDELRFAATTTGTFIIPAGNRGIERIVVGTGNGATAVTSGLAAVNVDARGLDHAIAITGNSGANILYGTAFNDSFSGGNGIDRVNGYDGNDTLDGGREADTLTGGAGNDTYIVDNTSDATIEAAGGGIDTVLASAAVTLKANVENLTLTGAYSINGRGNGDANVITGNSGSNRLWGEGGNDTLSGKDGADQLDGGLGDDNLVGGTGNDIYFVNSIGDTVNELAGEGRDTVRSSMSYTLGSDVEWLELQGSSNLNANGNGLANVLKGNGGNNSLSGLVGNDKLYASAGNDSVDGGEGGDWLEGGAGTDQFTGGLGSDRFVFREGDFGGASMASADVIHDFVRAEGDKVRLDLVDADSTSDGNQGFVFLGTGAFTSVAGQLRYEQSGGNTFVQGDLDGDGIADFTIQLDGTVNLVSGDFIL